MTCNANNDDYFNQLDSIVEDNILAQRTVLINYIFELFIS